ncbi:MAG: right-handed parallel beta-helix repeat-containing protein, partial [Chitinophagaceae bacterium]
SHPVPADAIIVVSGESIQKALDQAAGKNRVVLAKAGLHTLPGTLRFPSGVTLSGEGVSTVLWVDPASGERDAIVNAAPDLHDITIRDLVVEGSVKIDRGTDPNSSRSFKNEGNRGGIIFRANVDGEMKKLHFVNLTVRNCTYNGVFIAGAASMEFNSCDFDENGSSVIPGPKLQHNLLLSHCEDITVTNSRFDTSPYGAGISLIHCSRVKISGSEIARNAYYGVQIAESKHISITGCLVEANDRSGIMMEYLYFGNKEVNISHNTIWFNGGFAVETYAGKNINVYGNLTKLNGAGKQEIFIGQKKMIME